MAGPSTSLAGLSPLPPAACRIRTRCASSAADWELTSKLKEALRLLGLESTATPRGIKLRYYDLAKRTHPDVLARQAKDAALASATGPQVSRYDDGVLEVNHSSPVTTVLFREVQDAYDVLLAAEEEAKGGTRSTGPAPGARAGRPRTFGEVMCDQLKDAPEATADLWDELVHQRVTCTAPMADVIFKACQKGDADQARGMSLARAILREGTGLGLISQDVRGSSMVQLLNWCLNSELECADALVDEANDLDRTDPGVMAAIGALYCSGTRSPY